MRIGEIDDQIDEVFKALYTNGDHSDTIAFFTGDM